MAKPTWLIIVVALICKVRITNFEKHEYLFALMLRRLMHFLYYAEFQICFEHFKLR